MYLLKDYIFHHTSVYSSTIQDGNTQFKVAYTHSNFYRAGEESNTDSFQISIL